jgi:hypothetical protein
MIHHNVVGKLGFLGDFGGAQPLRIKQQQNFGSSRQPTPYVTDAFKVSVGMPCLFNATSPVESEGVILEKL